MAEVVEGIPPATALVSDTDCVRAADEVWCEKSTAEGRTYRKIAGLSGIRDVVGRESQVCALLEDGRVLCWGQVGRKIFYDNTPPGHHPSLWMPGWRSHEVIREKPSALRGARGLAALAHMRCGRTKRGGVVVIEELCRNSQCGSIARAVPKLRDVVSVVESGSSICVVRLADGSTVEVTGRSFRPDASMPPVSKVRAPTSEPAEQWRGARRIEATIHVACALFEHGVFRCRSTDEGAKLEPVPGLGTVVDFDVETDGGCAVLDDGTLRCWQVDVRGKLSGVRDPTVRG